MISLDGSSLTIDQLIAIADRGEPVTVASEALVRVRAARAVVDGKAQSDDPIYGINTGFGSFADVKIAPDALETLQRNLLRSHAAGLGPPLAVRAVRAAMALRANVLAKGFSGVRVETLNALVAMLNAQVHPVVPSRGSVGASGDLAPLAHMALVLIGEGEAWLDDGPPAVDGPPIRLRQGFVEPADASAEAGAFAKGEGGHDVRDGGRGRDREDRDEGERLHPRALRLPSVTAVPGAEALRQAGLSPIALGPKEGLALINGTQPSTAVLALALDGAERLVRAADIAAALSIDALRGSIHPFEARIHEARGFVGQTASAANIAALILGSGINRSHELCGRVQDAYSMRCAAQVHGATRDALAFVRRTVETEANAATDNPMVFADAGEIVSCGNFHGAPVALAADLLASALVPLATISERRTDRLVDPGLSELPAFLTREGGLRSGLMMAQVTAAAVASELKTLAHPAGADTIPTSANKEDHVSMSMAAALKAERALASAREVLAIEVLCACQAIDLLAPLDTSPALARVVSRVRTRVPTLDDDRPPAPDIIAITELIATGDLENACGVRVK